MNKSPTEIAWLAVFVTIMTLASASFTLYAVVISPLFAILAVIFAYLAGYKTHYLISLLKNS